MLRELGGATGGVYYSRKISTNLQPQAEGQKLAPRLFWRFHPTDRYCSFNVPSPAGVVRLILGDGTMTTNIPLVLNAAQAASRLGLSVSTLAKLRLSGAGPAYSKLGRRVVYRLEDLEAWIVANRYQSTSEYTTRLG